MASRTYKIAVIPGDGIGEEVVREGLKVLDAASSLHGFSYEAKNYPFSADYYLETGISMPDDVFDEFRQLDAILLGAIGDPRIEVGMLERAIIAGIRFKLDLYINLRPIKLYAEHLCPLKGKTPADVDFVVVRENTEDAYAGIGGHLKVSTEDEVAIQSMIYTRKGCERAVRYAYDLARERGGKKRLTLVDKANAIRAQDIWTRTFAEVGAEYPDIEQDHAYVDAACMWMLKKPEWYDVIVTTNLFGDIITDLGAMIQGGMGIAASGNLHPGKVSMFEPIHGSAPKYRGQNKANPIATIAAIQMLLDYVGEKDAASQIEGAISNLLSSQRIPTLDASSGLGTDEIGNLVVEELRRTVVSPS